MTTAADYRSGKGAGDENFPVASHLIAPRHRAPIMAFYRVARLADDVADHPAAAPGEKLAKLKEIEDSLTGAGEACPEAVALKQLLAERRLPWSHALDLLEAFRRDVIKLRYETWDELMDYCRYSAAPVGRFVLDVHGESPAIWPASDALCAALQVINHLQDCAKDYRDLDRVYLPQETLRAFGAEPGMLAAPRSNPAIAAAIRELSRRTRSLLVQSRPFAGKIVDLRLALEVGAIQRLAESLNERLSRQDPLSEEVHHGPLEALGAGLGGAARTLRERLGARNSRQAAP